MKKQIILWILLYTIGVMSVMCLCCCSRKALAFHSIERSWSSAQHLIMDKSHDRLSAYATDDKLIVFQNESKTLIVYDEGHGSVFECSLDGQLLSVLLPSLNHAIRFITR